MVDNENHSPRDEITGFVYSRGYQKTDFLKVEWGERLKDYDLQPTVGLEPRDKRRIAAGRRARRLPSADGPKTGKSQWQGAKAGDSRQSESEGPKIDPIVFLGPDVDLTMPGLKPEENKELKARVLARIDAQVAEIQTKTMRRMEKMNRLGFLSADHNRARAEAMLKLEIRKRVRLEEIKLAAWQEIRREQAKAEPQEGLFANLEAKLINILDAVGSLDTVASNDLNQTKERKSVGRRTGGRGAGAHHTGGAEAEHHQGEPPEAFASSGLNQLLRDEKSIEALQSASEEDLLTALRSRRGTGGVIPPGEKAAKVKGPWKDLPEWTQRTQRQRQAGSEDNTPRSERMQTPRTESEFSAHSDDEYENEPVIQLGVPHMFGDKTSLYGTNVETKDSGVVTIPAGVDWLLDSPRDGEGHLTSAYSRKAVVSAAYQPHDLLGMSNAEDVMDDLLRDLDGDTPMRGSESLQPDTTPIEMSSFELPLAGAVGVRNAAAGQSTEIYDAQTDWMVAENQAVAKEVDEIFKEVREPMASGGGLAGRVQKGPYQPDDSLASMPAAPTAGALGEWVAKDVEIESAMEEMARRERARKRRADKVKVKAEEDQPGTASSLGSRGSSRRGGGGSAIQAHLSDDTGRVPSPVPLPAEVQRRLEQLWADLRMPVMEKLDMAVKYTAGDADHLVHDALPKWEQVAELIVRRENALVDLAASLLESPDGTAGITAFQKSRLLQQHKDLHSTADSIRQLCGVLQRSYGDAVTYDGKMYVETLRNSDRENVIGKIDRAMTTLGHDENE